MGKVYSYGLTDFQAIATGAAVLASGGGGGSYHDACAIVQQLADQGYTGTVQVQDYDGATNACVLAIMGSPDAADNLTLTAVQNSINNTVAVMQAYTGMQPGAFIPVEIGPINSLVPLIGAALSGGSIWVVNGDGAGRARTAPDHLHRPRRASAQPRRAGQRCAHARRGGICGAGLRHGIGH